MADYTVGSGVFEDEFTFNDFISNQEPEFTSRPEPGYGQIGYRTSLDNPSGWVHSDPWFGIGLFDAIGDHDPYNQEALDFAANIKYQNEMARDPNYQFTLPKHEKLGKFSGYELLPKGFFPSFNPSLIENNPSVGLDYMRKIFGGIGRLGVRKNINDDEWNAYANWGKVF